MTNVYSPATPGLNEDSPLCARLARQPSSPNNDPEEFEFEPEPLTADLYGCSITSIIRDVRKVVLGEGRSGLRFAKVGITVGVLWLTIAMQIFLMVEFRRMVTKSSVHKIREMYSEYELWMYDRNTETTSNGFHRGIPGHFQIERFSDVPDNIDKEFICSIPFSQPYFFICILMVWTFTVVIDLREIFFYAELLLVRTDTVASVQEILEEREDHIVVLRGLTFPFKVLLTLLIFLPRLAIDLILLWLGCRWLTSTASFGDVLLNAIALEFVLLLKDLIYNATVPKRNQWETSTMLVPHKRKTKASWGSYLGSFAWLLVVCTWVILYILRFQQVLPDYRWDVHDACEDFIDTITRLTVE